MESCLETEEENSNLYLFFLAQIKISVTFRVQIREKLCKF